MDIAAISSGLQPGADGIWRSTQQSQISYPEDGNLNCLALEEDSFWFVHRNLCIETVIKAFPPPGMVFDIGGGNGYVTMGLQKAGIPVALLEPGWQGVLNAQKRGVDTLICSTLEDAHFQSNALPAVGLFDVLEHIADDLAFLKQIHQYLTPGGRVYLTVPAYQGLWSADDTYAGHFRRYTRPALRRLFCQAGFEVDFASYIFWMLPPAIWFGRVIPTRLGLRKEEAWDRYEQEHRNQPGMVGAVFDACLGWERKTLQSGRAVPFGGSCLVVARRAASQGE